jgi:hypothetical protein
MIESQDKYFRHGSAGLYRYIDLQLMWRALSYEGLYLVDCVYEVLAYLNLSVTAIKEKIFNFLAILQKLL